MAENAINNATSSSNTTASNAELEAMKQEILREMRKEMTKMKQDIIEGKLENIFDYFCLLFIIINFSYVGCKQILFY